MKKVFLKISVVLIVAFGVVAQQPPRIQQDVKYLASDELEGRLTGTKGATEAGRYIAREFGRLGLKPVASSANRSESRYLQQFPYVAGVSLGKRNQMILKVGFDATHFKAVPEEVGTSWLPLGFSSSASVEGRVVFAGYGITASELSYNDYASVNATGKVVIVL